MLIMTPYGKDYALNLVRMGLSSVHLYVDKGELKGYGYEPVGLDPEKWEGITYPDILWTLRAGEQPARVMGYYVAAPNGAIVLSEEFPTSTENDDDQPGFVIGREGDRIRVSLRLNLFSRIMSE